MPANIDGSIPDAAIYQGHFEKGQEMGWFEHGSTILVLASKGIALCEGARPASTIRMGEDLMRVKGE